MTPECLIRLNIRNWVPISDELFVVLKRVVATSREGHDTSHALNGNHWWGANSWLQLALLKLSALVNRCNAAGYVVKSKEVKRETGDA